MRTAVLLILLTGAGLAEDWCHPRGGVDNTGVTKNHGPKRQPDVSWEREEKGTIGTAAALSAGRLVYGVGEFSVICRGERNGVEYWEAKVKQQVVSSPSIYEELAFFGGQDTVHYRIKLSDGGEPATVEAKAAIVAPPAVADDYYFNGSVDGQFYAMGAKSGKLLWNRETGPVRHAPAFARGWVYVTNEQGVLHAFDARRGVEAWRLDTKSAPLGAPILDGKSVLLPLRDRVLVVNAKRGQETESLATPGISAAPVLDKACLLYGTEQGEVVSLNLKTGKESGRAKVAEEKVGTPLLLASRILYGAAGATLFAVDPKTHKVLWTFEGEAPFQPPIVANKALYVGAGTVFYCLR